MKGSARFVIRLARREARASWRRFAVLILAVAIGVGALVAINSFTENMQGSVRGRARALLGADLAVRSGRPFPARTERLLDSLAARPGVRRARVTFLGAMAYVPRSDGARTVTVTAVEGGYPFYGDIETEPAGQWPRIAAGERVALVDPSLLTALDARVGDTLALGEGRFAIAGALRNFPGDVGLGSAFSPRVAIAARHLEQTGILTFGSRAQRGAFYALPPGTAAGGVADRLRVPLRADRVNLRTADEDQENLGEALTRMAGYLGLVALVALLLGGLGVASAVHVFVRQKEETIAVLRCLGATTGEVFAVYLLQAAAMGLGGSLLGVALGVLVQQALPQLVAGFVPVDVEVTLSWRSVAMGVGTGLWVALVFSLLPLLATRRIAPLAALRRAYEPAEPAAAGRRRPRDWWRVAAMVLVAASVVALAALQAGRWTTGLGFAAGIGVALGVLALVAWLLVRAVRRWFPSRWPYVWRQGLANLYRPANQTVAVILALGFGAFLLATLLVAQRTLLDTLELRGGALRPNLVLVDVQTDQRAAADSLLRGEGLPVTGPVPIVPMRIQSIRGRPVTAILADTAAGREGEEGRPPGWTLRREYRSTYRDSVMTSEKIVAGEWFDGPNARAVRARDGGGAGAAAGGPTAVSIELGLATDLGVEVGDEIVWDVQGVRIPSRVTSIREVDWARFEPNFFFVFQPGALAEAPQSAVYLTRVGDAAARGRLQRRLAERFPNVTTLDLALVQEVLERVVSRVVLAIRFMAFFSLATGGLVLFGAVATSRFQRVREAVLLKTLGATRTQVARVLLAEYLALGLLAALTALGLAVGAGWALARFMFDVALAVPVAELAALAAGVVALTVVVGVGNSLDVLRRPPLEVLREA